MATTKKKAAGLGALSENDLLRSPRPLPPFVPTGHPALDATLLELRGVGPVTNGAFDAARRIIPELSPESRLASVHALDGDALDLGAPTMLHRGGRVPSSGHDLSAPGAQKAFQRLFDAVYSAHVSRARYLKCVMVLLADHGPGRERLLKIALDGSVAAETRLFAANMLVGVARGSSWSDDAVSPQHILEAVAALLETVPELVVPAANARAAIDPDGIVDALVRAISLHTANAELMAGVLTVLSGSLVAEEVIAHHEGLANALAPTVRSGDHWSLLPVAARLCRVPALTEAVSARADEHFAKFPDALLEGPLQACLLRHVGAPAARHLARGVSLDERQTHEALDALREWDDPTAAPILRAMLGPRERSLKQVKPALLAKAHDLISFLERNGKAPSGSAPSRSAPLTPAGSEGPFPSLRAQTTEARARLKEAKLGKKVKAIIDLGRQGVEMVLSRADAVPSGATKFGGLPDLPPHTPWPCHGEHPLDFLLQVRLEEVAPIARDPALPTEGTLWFFILESYLEGEGAPEYLETCKVLYAPSAEKLIATTPPPAYAKRHEGGPRPRPFPQCAVRLHPTFKLPPHNHEALASLLTEDERDTYAEVVLGGAPARHQLGGHVARELDPSARGDHHILTCLTDEVLTSHWGDMDAVHFFHPRSVDAAGRSDPFSRATSLYGNEARWY